MTVTRVLLAGGALFAVSLTLSAILTAVVRTWSRRRGFVDRPASGEHKQHAQPTPLGGGIAITATFVIMMVVALAAAFVVHRAEPTQAGRWAEQLPHWQVWAGGVVTKSLAAMAILIGAVVMHLLGLLDDHRPLSPFVKLAAQTAVALILTIPLKIRAAELLGDIPAVFITTLWIVGLTNAFNFMDNMDGLSAGVAGLAALILAVASFAAGQVFVPCMLLVLAGAVSGFLCYNFPPASIFMGDAGSLVIGYLLAVATVLTTFVYPDRQHTPFNILVPVVVFAVPLYDFLSVVADRFRRGVSIFRGDRRHFSHRLVGLGLSPKTAVLTIYLATAATSLPAILLPLVTWPGAVLILSQCVCVVAIIAILESRHAR